MVIVVITHPIEMIPPVLSLLRVAKCLGEEVQLIGLTYTAKSIASLREFDIPYTLRSQWPVVRFRENPIRSIWWKLRKKFGCNDGVMDYSCAKRTYLRREISRHILDDDSILITTNMTTVALIGDMALKLGKRHVHWSLELGDRNGIGWKDFNEKMFFKTATFVACEENRARIMMESEGLKQRPFVLPNKSYGHPRKRYLPVTEPKAKAVVELWRGKKVFLYQGSLGADRAGIVDLLAWLCEEFPDCIVGAMTGCYSKEIHDLDTHFKNFNYIPHVVSPHHLEVTSHASVGIAVYSARSIGNLSPLNAVYCAPNKTFECAGFGIPILCNDVPGLVDSVGVAKAGVCTRLHRQSMIDAAHRILDNYSQYSKNATRFFESVNEQSIIGNIFSYARS